MEKDGTILATLSSRVPVVGAPITWIFQSRGAAPMASRNLGRSRRDEGSAPQGREPAQGRSQQVREGAEQIGSRLREGYGAVRDDLAQRYGRSEAVIARNPMSSVLISFGVG